MTDEGRVFIERINAYCEWLKQRKPFEPYVLDPKHGRSLNVPKFDDNDFPTIHPWDLTKKESGSNDKLRMD